MGFPLALEGFFPDCCESSHSLNFFFIFNKYNQPVLYVVCLLGCKFFLEHIHIIVLRVQGSLGSDSIAVRSHNMRLGTEHVNRVRIHYS